MFETLQQQPADKIIEMIALFKADTRETKMDLGVGVYKTETGATPILTAVKKAEAKLLASQQTKSYTALAGHPEFLEFMRELSLGDSVPAERVAAVATPGGTGAIHQLYELIKISNPNARVWTSRPTWGNHIAMLKHLGMAHTEYTYFDKETCAVNFDAMMKDLGGIGPDDVIILHGCCHNPTGANLTSDQWHAVAELIDTRGALAFVDLAYQGFGDGLEADVEGLRILASKLPEFVVAQSCSKNFGLYRDRVGVAFVISTNADESAIAQNNLNTINRLNFSFPPDHGAALLIELANDKNLLAEWKTELENMRMEMLTKREALAQALKRETNSDRFNFIAEHRGMFSLIGIPEEAVMKLRDDYGIYMVTDSRINIAGIQLGRVDDLAKAIASVL